MNRNKLNSKNLFSQYSNNSSKLIGIKKNKKQLNNSTSNKYQLLNKIKEDINFEKALRDYQMENISKNNHLTNPYLKILIEIKKIFFI